MTSWRRFFHVFSITGLGISVVLWFTLSGYGMDRLLGAACALFFVLFLVNMFSNRTPKGVDHVVVFDDKIPSRLKDRDSGLDDL